MITFAEPFLPAAPINTTYYQVINVSGGVKPYVFAFSGGIMPPGLQLSNDGVLSGQATTLGVYSFEVTVTDSVLTVGKHTYQFTVLDIITLSDATVDQDQFVAQFQNVLSKSGTWSAGLTTQTSQTLIEYISAVGTFVTSRIVRAIEDAFPETAQSDSAIRAIVNMQGLRLARKLPAVAPVTLISTLTVTLPSFTQFSAGGYNWFNSETIFITADVPMTVTLKEGLVTRTQVAGLGTDLQVWVSQDDQFTVSDQDVKVTINGADLFKVYGALWNYKGSAAFADSTLSDGRLQVQFGSQGYGAVPKVNDSVVVTYAKTQGDDLNGAAMAGVKISSQDAPSISGMFQANPSGGADTKSTTAYKNFAAGSFGTYSSGVTKAQYSSLVNNYPGIIDAVTQAQREINPAALEWMNVIRVAGLTASPWSQVQIEEFLKYMQSVTMYSTKFVWMTPQPVPRKVNMSLYCFNSVNSLGDVIQKVETAIRNLFSIRPGILMTDFYISDLIDTANNAAPGQISYVLVNEPTHSMIVTALASPFITYTIHPTGGSLSPQLYAYSVSIDSAAPNDNFMGMLDGTQNPPLPFPTAIGQYWLVNATGTVAGVAANAGDQYTCTDLAGGGSFTITPAASTAGVRDLGVPNRWVSPEVTAVGSSIDLDWEPDPSPLVLGYRVWGRRQGHIGILATMDSKSTFFSDPGGPDPAPVPISQYPDTLIRYNSLESLIVTADYAQRQSSVLFPVRDSLL